MRLSVETLSTTNPNDKPKLAEMCVRAHLHFAWCCHPFEISVQKLLRVNDAESETALIDIYHIIIIARSKTEYVRACVHVCVHFIFDQLCHQNRSEKFLKFYINISFFLLQSIPSDPIWRFQSIYFISFRLVKWVFFLSILLKKTYICLKFQFVFLVSVCVNGAHEFHLIGSLDLNPNSTICGVCARVYTIIYKLCMNSLNDAIRNWPLHHISTP